MEAADERPYVSQPSSTCLYFVIVIQTWLLDRLLMGRKEQCLATSLISSYIRFFEVAVSGGTKRAAVITDIHQPPYKVSAFVSSLYGYQCSSTSALVTTGGSTKQMKCRWNTMWLLFNRIVHTASSPGEPRSVLVSTLLQRDSDANTNETIAAKAVQKALLWGEIDLLNHHFHPSVAKFASNVRNGEAISYDGDPLKDFILGPFWTDLRNKVIKSPKSNNLTETE
jgi:hypothetical protein